MIFIYILGTAFIFFLFTRLFVRNIWRIKKIPHKTFPSSIGLDYSEEWIEKEGGGKLFVWWIENGGGSDKAIIFQHGWGQNAERMIPYMNVLKKTSAILIAADFTGHGRSPDEKFPNMYIFSKDIQHIMDFAQNKTGRKLAFTVFGHSVGGSAAISAAGRDNRIKRVVTLGAPSHPYDIMKYEFDRRNLPSFISELMLKYIEYKIGQKFNSFAPSEVISKSDAVMLVIHGAEDKVVPVEQVYKLIDKANRDLVSPWVLEGINHSNFTDYPGFARRLSSFLNE